MPIRNHVAHMKSNSLKSPTFLPTPCVPPLSFPTIRNQVGHMKSNSINIPTYSVPGLVPFCSIIAFLDHTRQQFIRFILELPLTSLDLFVMLAATPYFVISLIPDSLVCPYLFMSLSEDLINATNDARSLLSLVPIQKGYSKQQSSNVALHSRDMLTVQDDSFFYEGLSTKAKLSALGLLVHLSPATGEPVFFHVNVQDVNVYFRQQQKVLASDNPNKPEEFSYLGALEKNVSINYDNIGGRPPPIHMHVSSVIPHVQGQGMNDMDAAMKVRTNRDAHLQSIASMQCDLEGRGYNNMILAMQDQIVRDVSVDEMNQLHYLLNIPFSFADIKILNDNSSHSKPLMCHVCEMFKKVNVSDASEFLQFIHDDLEIPLFYTYANAAPPSITTQWLYLSLFLQMCSPVTLSPVEGGHRTWELVRYLTGSPFTQIIPTSGPESWTSKIPHSFRELHAIVPNGVAQLEYCFYFWQRFSTGARYDESHAKQLRDHGMNIWLRLQRAGRDTAPLEKPVVGTGSNDDDSDIAPQTARAQKKIDDGDISDSYWQRSPQKLLATPDWSEYTTSDDVNALALHIKTLRDRNLESAKGNVTSESAANFNKNAMFQNAFINLWDWCCNNFVCDEVSN